MSGRFTYNPQGNGTLICTGIRRHLIAILVLFFFSPVNLFAQPLRDDGEENNYDEITLVLNVQRIGSLEIPAIIFGQTAYLPVKDIFDFLKIKCDLSPDMDLATGFFINPAAPFSIDKTEGKILYMGKIFTLEPGDIIKTESNLFLKADYFGKVFGLDCIFNFRSLSVTLTTKIELPAIREMQLELMRRNISRLRGERKADTVIERSFKWLHLGMADWAVYSVQQSDGFNYARFNLGLGAIIAGGEANLHLNYSNNQPFNKRQQYYSWRYVDNNKTLIRQITAGKIFVQSNATVNSAVTGMQFTNMPTTYRRSFGTYTLSNTTQPGWIVELYVNNVLVNYIKADASGFFSFEVPMVYGSSAVKLRYYGPWGEERTSEQFMNIPFNFIPENQFEYTVTGGVISDGTKSRFGRANFNYGVSRHITIGGGVEYLSSVTSGKSMPYLNASVRMGPGLLLSGEYISGVRSKGTISYRRPSNLQAEFNYIKYNPKQTAVKFNYLEEKRFVVSMPVRGKKFSAFTRLTLDQIMLPKSKFTSAEFLVSSVICGISSNLTTYAILSEPKPLVYSNLSISFRLPAGIRFTPQAQYEYRQKNISSVKGEVEKTLFARGFVNFLYEKNYQTKANTFVLGFRYNFSFVQTAFGARQTGRSAAYTQSLRGSLLYDKTSRYVGTGNQTSVGKSGLIIHPFLDINCNGTRDAGEPVVSGLNFRINGGRIEENRKDSTTRVTGLEAYNNYFIEFDKNSFDNVAWQIKNLTMTVVTDPNSFKLIEVPVAVVGEVSGSINLKSAKGTDGLGRIIVNIYNSNSKLVAHTLSEQDGYFSYMGLAPGNYTAVVDPAQLGKLNMTASPAVLSFTIKPGKDGDVADGLDFVLKVDIKAETGSIK